MTTPLSALPPVPDAALPAAVRQGSAAERQTYKAALGFERLLVEQLLKSAVGTQGPLSEGPHAAAVQGALADAMVVGGGFGLAAQLHTQIRSGE